ncbi:MAG: nucleotide sugar dehydrogenase [Phycisphaerales bacterium JB050]
MSTTTASADTFSTLMDRIESRTATCGIIGLGYVGLPLAGALHDAGFPVIGFDVDPKKITMLNAGESYLKHLGEDLATGLSTSERFQPTADFSRLGECDVIIVCVPTPVGRHLEPDLSYVLDTARAIGRTLRKGQLISLESTTYPRTTRDDFLPAMLETAATDLSCGEDFFVAFSPEREDPGRKSHNTKTIPKLVGGLDDRSTQLATKVYSAGVAKVIPVSSAEIAESAKILENVFRAVNIAMVNELKVLFDRMGIDVWEVIEAAATKPFGFMPFYPGPGLGGHCIPIDPFYLTWKAKEYGLPTRFIELAGEVNHRMPEFVVHKCADALNDRSRSLRGSRVLIIGMAYKPNVDDTRETPAVEIAEQLMDLGAEVVYHDPHVPIISGLRKYPGLEMRSVDLSEAELSKSDLVLVATDHDAVDWNLIGRAASLVVDTRNAMTRAQGVTATVVKA